MEVLQIAGLGIIATILTITVKKENPEIALQISIVTGILIFLFIVTKIGYVVKVLNDLARRIDIDFMYLSIILKVVGIAYITEFAAQISRDAGEGSIADKVELAGKVLIMVVSIPILMALLEMIIKIIP